MKTIPLKLVQPERVRPPPAPPPKPAHWRLPRLLAAPHRLGFFAATCVLCMAAAWWAAALALRVWPVVGLPAALPPVFVHAPLMTLGFLPLFFTGFLFTAGPRWLHLGEVQAALLLLPVLACAAGWTAFLAGGMLSMRLATAGLVIATMGWCGLTAHFASLVRASGAADKLHARVVAMSCVLGCLAMAAAAWGAATARPGWLLAAARLGLWLFIVPVYLTVAHRMLPFFTSNVLPALDAWRPNWLLGCLLAGSWSQALAWGLEQAGQDVAAVVLRMAVGGLYGSGALLLSWRWGVVQSMHIRLLAMLHLGFLWLGLAFVLDWASAAAWLASSGTTAWPMAGLHACTMGFLGSIALAMVTRVSCGHSGRTLVADDFVWVLFWTLQAAVFARVLAALWTGAPAHAVQAVAAFAWLTAWAAWAARHLRWWGLPRVDGKPG